MPAPHKEVRHAAELTRQSLYELVWKEPIQALAPRFGLSDRGLSKLCERYAIPTPPRGYWAKRHAGKKVIRAPLIQLEGSRMREDYPIAQFKPANTKPADDNAPDPIAAFWRAQLEEIGVIAVPRRLTAPHPIIARWIEADARERAYASRWRSAFIPSPPSSLERRRLRILSALYIALEARGVKVVERDQRARDVLFRHEHDEVGFELTEYVQQKRRPLTEAERADSWNGQSKYRQERIPSGRLRGRIVAFGMSGVPVLWTESDERPFETLLSEVAAGVIAALAQAKARREQREKDERRRREARAAEQRLEEARQAELARKQALRNDATNWREARNLRAYVSAVLADKPSDEALLAWSRWALACADELDPVASCASTH